jgi:hypothetical protein
MIYESLGLPCVFLRFNPDNFRVENKLQKVSMNERLDLLVRWINVCMTMNVAGVLYKYLYYNEFDETNASFIELDDLKLSRFRL